MERFTGIKKILVPVDFSEAVPALVHYAMEIVRGRGARVRLFHVVGPPLPAVDPATGPAPDPGAFAELRESARVQLEGIAGGIKGLTVDTRVVVGFAAQEIVREAGEWGADVVVIGTHGRTGLRRVVLGSVAEAVVRRAPCPVLAVRLRGEAPPPD
jgi:nucleotide-binding universal stress UspA family protein